MLWGRNQAVLNAAITAQRLLIRARMKQPYVLVLGFLVKNR